MGIFKAYDIRGIVPDELDVNLARRIGFAFAEHIGGSPLLVGRDMRVHSPEIAEAVIAGMRGAGAHVIDIGLASTPMTYFAIGSQDVAGGLCVTASHNTGEYNGMKLCSRGARPISMTTGIAEIELACAGQQRPSSTRRGGSENLDLLQAYAQHVAGFARIKRPLTVAIDVANGMAGHTLPAILPLLENVDAKTIFLEPDGTFPNHEANPLKEENLDPVRELVRQTKADFGVSFDGDADRCCFVDETGATVPADLMTALLARDFLVREPGKPIVYDLRSSWVVKEEITNAGGVAVRDRVGHSFIKATMRDNGAIFGGELSGHFYFRDNFVCDSGVIALVSVLNLLSGSDESFSSRVADLRRYHATGEINFQVEDKGAVLETLKEHFRDGVQDELDGITVEYGSLKKASWWWFNVRASNTEPVLRLNLEAKTAELRDQKRAELIELIVGTEQ
jgi:phosphomannomutase